jgi:DNA-binding transcriptional ArsR family regulator
MITHMDAFETLADRTRRQLVETLRRGEQPVNDIVAALDIHQSGVSRHLRILLAAGFVRMRPEGQQRLYSLRPEPFRDLESWLGSYRDLWEARLDRFDAALDAKRAERPRTRKLRKGKDT